MILPERPLKERLDLLLVQKELVETRTRAQARILAGEVIVNDHRIDKPGTKVPIDAEIRLKGSGNPYVSRGGMKLKAALDAWPAPVESAICLDVGASTGGFTDVLLQAGAQRIYAVDVGYGQLAWSLRTDPRVVNLERTHIRDLSSEDWEEKPTILVVDVSFISLLQALPHALPHLAPKAWLYVLIKPQFEVGRAHVGRGGIVRDLALREETVKRIVKGAEQLGLQKRGLLESPLKGADGNVEYIAGFLHGDHS
jgi:23S rRNA (cytidine1920-2'-O)/16S rRNA (cytidine1409-2'-O)-methyltransferase